jgi:hypothetical protein
MTLKKKELRLSSVVSQVCDKFHAGPFVMSYFFTMFNESTI